MNPLYLGTGERRIFAMYDAAQSPCTRARAAVLCNPWGGEYVYAHRSLRQLALKLAARGYHTFRFDFFGTGDSAGELAEADLVGWQADLVSAIDGIKDIAGTARVALVGLRLGANIAAAVATRLADQVDALVMWDPIVCGDEYLHSLRAVSQPVALAGDPDAVEADGFVLTGAMARSLATIDLREAMAAPPRRALLLVTERLASHDLLDHAAAALRTAPMAIEYLPAPCPWVESVTTTGAVPVRALERIVEWLD